MPNLQDMILEGLPLLPTYEKALCKREGVDATRDRVILNRSVRLLPAIIVQLYKDNGSEINAIRASSDQVKTNITERPEVS